MLQYTWCTSRVLSGEETSSSQSVDPNSSDRTAVELGHLLTTPVHLISLAICISRRAATPHVEVAEKRNVLVKELLK